ncbi:uncharacterized protein LOC106643421 [Copidosoma floridanum]|uniref:uncharacterized protein LOC106643421 n=1 Tax=Copidosoma floridanum TaxID=29053 RepID=UPI0006C9B33B|nr:uncharacterized protein LOC106643421 [Copidosoma floridanum]
MRSMLQEFFASSGSNLSFADDRRRLLEDKDLTKRSSLRCSHPFIYEQGLIRVEGWLDHSTLTNGEKHPIILPGGCLLTKRLVQEAHSLTIHGGPQLMLSVLNSTFWIIRGTRVITAVFHQCVSCARYQAKNASQLMGQLPAYRLTPTRPFTVTGLDYAGPLSILFSKGRGAKSTKGYVVIFMCMVVKAIHIKVVSDLTVDAFLAAFSRFCACRGTCSTSISDNASTFKEAAPQLNKLFNESSAFVEGVNSQLAIRGIKWTFIPPRAPHFGGTWESAVKSIKHHFKRVVGTSTFTFEELATLCAKIEACLNSRPLCPLSSDEASAVALTLAHFLVGSSLLAYPEPYCEQLIVKNNTNTNNNSNNNFFWARWKKEVLHHMQLRNKWLKPQPNLQVGDIVLLKEDNILPSHWPLGRVTITHKGDDNLIRAVTVQTTTSTFKRPVVKLVKLPTESELQRCYQDHFKNQASDQVQ